MFCEKGLKTLWQKCISLTVRNKKKEYVLRTSIENSIRIYTDYSLELIFKI